ncbi:MAG: hypothetical protein JXR86_09895 [Spirochaetales bacterium]|nr:hypothetical protein [Spirochaetales bacterium]
MKQTLRIITRFSLYPGLLILGVVAISLIVPELLPEIYSRVTALSVPFILLSGFLIDISLLFRQGYKRIPFKVNFLLGNMLIAAALFNDHLPSDLPIHDGYTLLASMVFFLMARYVMAQDFLDGKRFGLVIPILVLVSNTGIGILAEPSEDIRYNGELDEILVQIHPAWETVEGFQEDLALRLENLSDSREKEHLIDELNRRIRQMEIDQERFDSLKEENRKRDEEIRSLKEKIGELNLNRKSYETVARVMTYEEAVRPTSPIVRDFAVKLASAYPGTYYRYSRGNNPVPGREGIQQILAIHRYIASEWSYINDPLFEQSDYYSPADRTIALGLAGDCDDYAILMASAVEAIGGKARILYGTCVEGAHAWCEVYIGPEEVWRQAQSQIGRHVSYLPPGADGAYWLCLDWQIGTYSCGNNPRVLYES